MAKYWFIRVVFEWLRFVAVVGLLATSVRAAEEVPGLGFLAYLGIWQENDEEWLAVSEWEGNEKEAPQAPQEERKDDEKEN